MLKKYGRKKLGCCAMDSEEEKTREIHETSESSSKKTKLSHRLDLRLFETQNTVSMSSNDDKNHVAERRFSGSVPPDLTFEILSRLSAKPIARYRLVSKLWSSITTTPEFTNQFTDPSSPPCVLLIFQKGDTRFVFSFPQHQNPLDPYSEVERYEVINPNDRHLACSESVHGLICFETRDEQLVIWNPTTRRFFTLPEPENSLGSVIGFLGYDPIECKYKVLSFRTDARIHVLTLEAQESWRMTQDCPIHAPIIGCGRCINGVLFYKCLFGFTLKHAIMSFDLIFETFSLIEYPMGNHSHFLMVPYEGRLALASSMASSVELWILEDAEKQKWSHKYFLYPPSDKEWTCLDLKGVTDAGELVYTPRSFYDSFDVVYFDPKSKSIRETKFGGIVCNEFRRLKGLGFDPLNDLDVFPNHIESLFSL